MPKVTETKRKIKANKKDREKRRKKLQMDQEKNRRSLEYFLEMKEKQAARDSAESQKSIIAGDTEGEVKEKNAETAQQETVEDVVMEIACAVAGEPSDTMESAFPGPVDLFEVPMTSDSKIMSIEPENSSLKYGLQEEMSSIDPSDTSHQCSSATLEKKINPVGTLECDPPNVLKMDHQSTGFESPQILIQEKQLDSTIIFNEKPQKNEPAVKVVNELKIPRQLTVPNEAAVANQNCKPQKSESEIEKLLEDETTIDLEYVNLDKKDVRDENISKVTEAGICEVQIDKNQKNPVGILECNPPNAPTMKQSMGFAFPQVSVQEKESDSSIQFNAKSLTKDLAVKIDEALTIPKIQKPVPMKAVSKNSKNQSSESQLKKLLKVGNTIKSTEVLESADGCPGFVNHNEKDAREDINPKAMEAETCDVPKNNGKPDSIDSVVDMCQLVNEASKKLKNPDQSLNALKNSDMAMEVCSETPLDTADKDSFNNPIESTPEYVPVVSNMPELFEPVVDMDLDEIMQETALKQEVLIAKVSQKQKSPRHVSEKNEYLKTTKTSKVSASKKLDVQHTNHSGSTCLVENALKQNEIPENEPPKIDAEPGVAPKSQFVPIWANFQDLEDSEEEPNLPVTPEKKPKETAKTGNGIADYVKFMQELKKNPPPPKIPKKTEETDESAVIRYRYEETDLIRKPMNLKDRRAATAYPNSRRSRSLIIKIGDSGDEKSMSADVRNLKKLLESLTFTVELAENLTAKQIGETIKRFGSGYHGDSAVIFFIAHGDQQGIIGCDKSVFELDEVYSLLSPEQAPRLAGKPKLIFSECCRGDRQHSGYRVMDEPRSAHGLSRSGMGSSGEKVGESTRTIPTNQDFLVCNATSHNNLAFADANYGTYHVQVLCQTFARRAHRDDLEKMLVEIRKRMAAMEFRGNGVLKKQMPEVTSTLTRAFFFNIPRKLKQ
ncbi:hypothetical protein B9Z55_016091 [Caenorhabditis nigoni]|uniref:Caspase family p20 domain-containing protein n=1 Tax=Caenorhabditis nigoni TaxID=1611254 RepID=A0A2G5UD67_9PELO|nr:hypothetical protein B9Z55_016091 [Caenorhabditis nigoni]